MLKAFEVDIATMKATRPTLHHGLSFTFLPIFFSNFFLLSTFIKILTECSSTSSCARHFHHKADRNSELLQPPGGREGFEVTAGGDGFLMFFLCVITKHRLSPIQHYHQPPKRDSSPALIRAAEVVAALQPGCEEMERE